MPFISIIMPVYNNETLLPKAVASVREQTFDDWELIIIDDGSTDNTPQVADELAEQDDRIKVIHQENQWIFRSYNNGYAAAAGKYVFIVNSDDTINPESLQRIHDIAVVDDADIVMFNLAKHVCDASQNIIIPDIYGLKGLLKEDFSYADRQEIHARWVDFLRMKLITHQCVYKAALAKDIKYRTDFFNGDAVYNIQIADQVQAAAGTAYQVYNHFIYQNEDGFMNASIGKYYGYEHELYNEYYLSYKNLFEKWDMFHEKQQSFLVADRLNTLTLEIRTYSSEHCRLTTEEKLQRILESASDELVYECAKSENRIEELESRVLSGLRELLLKELPDESSDFYFVYELLNALLRYEKEEEDMRKIKEAVYHKNNPRHIGECFLKKLKD